MTSLLALACLASCVVPVGIQGGLVKVPADAGASCGTQCESIGMELGAVAIMAGHVGCVCQPRSGGSEPALSATSAGMATIVVVAEQEKQQQHQSTH